MATFFSASGDQRDAGVSGDMPAFHHYAPSHHQYGFPDPSTVSLVPLPATATAPEEDEDQQGGGRSGLPFANAADEPPATSSAAAISLHRQLMMMGGHASATRHHGPLSLSLATQVSASLCPFRPASADASLLVGAVAASGGAHRAGIAAQSSHSQYLNATRELLDELVSVQDAIAKRKPDKNQSHGSADQEPAVDSAPAQLSPPERQELQNKVTALLAMLDEVEQGYRRYRQQMQALASSLDAAAGRGAARPYTALARQTISRHFRSLRDAIGAHLRSSHRSLGGPAAPSPGIHRLRQQQLGMLPPAAAWRPQRGLPEPAVSVLRAWLFEHFLHPYPKDSEKLMLARQTGLTRGQVSNWFINARVRLWKPMIEEMYKEEFGAEMDSNSSPENGGGGGEGKDEPVRSPKDRLQSPPSAAAMHIHGASQLSPFKPEEMAAADASITGLSRSCHDGGVLMQNEFGHHGGGGGGMRFLDFGDGVAGLGGYDGGSVSLTLGLHHRDSAGRLTVVTAEQPGLAPAVRRDGVYGGDAAFEYVVDGPDDRPQFGSTSPLLHDFVT